jgi:hypothetical protein
VIIDDLRLQKNNNYRQNYKTYVIVPIGLISTFHIIYFDVKKNVLKKHYYTTKGNREIDKYLNAYGKWKEKKKETAKYLNTYVYQDIIIN